MSVAILIIDVQEGFFEIEYADPERGRQAKKALAENLNRLLGTAREVGIPVFHIVTELLPDQSNWNLRMKDLGSAVCIKDTPGQSLIVGLQADAQDTCVSKYRYSAFFNTELEKHLRAQFINTLIMCGINTHACVRSSVVDAFSRDYRVFIPLECVASYDQEQHASSLKYMAKRIAQVVPLSEMIDRIRRDDFAFRFTE